MPGHIFLDLIIDLFKPKSDNDLIVTVVTNDGTFTFGPYGDTHGDNFLTITTGVGEFVDSVTISATTGFEGFVDLTPPRISAIGVEPVVPEPSSILLLGSGPLVFIQGLRHKLS